MPPAFAAAWEEALARVFAQGCGEQLGFEYPTPHGPRHFESRLIPERGPDGGVEHVLALTRDVTERVRSEVALAAALDGAQSARADAEAANASKSAFLATMSHELRTPLNAIRGYADLLALGVYGPVTDAQRAALRRIGQSERHLLGLIAEILDYARLESGRTRYHLADVAVNEVLVEARSLVEPQLRGKGIDFGYEPGGHEPLAARADAGKLRQIVLNLLSNALKFTPAGGAGGAAQPGRAGTGGGRGERLRARDSHRAARARVPAVRAAESYEREHARRHGARAGDQPRAGTRHGRRRGGRERGRHGVDLPSDAAAGVRGPDARRDAAAEPRRPFAILVGQAPSFVTFSARGTLLSVNHVELDRARHP
jgi:hypothetical protein